MIGRKESKENVKKSLMNDKELFCFYNKYFSSKDETTSFIEKCLNKLYTHRMMLRVKWYTDIADEMSKVKNSRPALQISFLVALAESIARRRHTKKEVNNLGSQKLVLDFFTYVSNSDKDELCKKFKRLLAPKGNHKLRTSSIVRILYQVRNNVVHGEEYWEFSLLNADEESHVSLITRGRLGKSKRKRNVNLEIKMKYAELRDIFIRTAIRNIESKF